MKEFIQNVNLVELIAALLAIYEALSRIIKTSKTWSIIGKILEFLNKISQYLDRKHK